MGKVLFYVIPLRNGDLNSGAYATDVDAANAANQIVKSGDFKSVAVVQLVSICEIDGVIPIKTTPAANIPDAITVPASEIVP